MKTTATETTDNRASSCTGRSRCSTWTSVKASLPDEGKHVLIADDRGVFAVARRKTACGGRTLWIIGHNVAHKPPSLWMDIPPVTSNKAISKGEN